MKLIMIGKIFILITVLCVIIPGASGQGLKPGENPINKIWPAKFVSVDIISSADGSIQKAWYYRSESNDPQPLIVSLHTWTGDYNQEDPLTKEILLRDWNYIHPDFRGINNKPQACGSDLVIPDIYDAIIYAVKNGNVEPSNVHIIGVSGGGYATLLAFMKLNYPVRSFHAWASISNLADWYRETKDRGLRYANDLEMVTTNGKGFDQAEAIKRSPVFMEYHPEIRRGASLSIYEGINDGYTGSVPVSQSINMFNKLAKEMYPDNRGEIVSDDLKDSLVARKVAADPKSHLELGGRKVHLYRKLPNLSLTIFEGGHEMIIPPALGLIPTELPNRKDKVRLNILTLGDSNGAGPDGWPEQLKKLLTVFI